LKQSPDFNEQIANALADSVLVPISRLLIGNWNNFADGPVAEFVTASVALGWDNGAQLKAF
jgi:hypothetical protein